MKESRTPRRRIAMLLGILVAVALTWWGWGRFPPGLPAPSGGPASAGDRALRELFYGPPGSLAVLPFAGVSESTEEAILGEGLAAAILDLLVEDPALQVTARSSSFFFRDRSSGYRVIAERLQSRHVLDGELRAQGERLVLALSLFDARVNREIWRQEYRADLAGLLGRLGQIGTDIVAELPVPSHQPTPAASPQPDPRAWTDFARGLYLADPLRAPDLAGAAEALESALAIDPDYAKARIELAGIWLHPAWPAGQNGGDSVSRARAGVQRVLDDDPEEARAWALMSFIHHRYDWDWAAAAAAGRRAARLRPGDAGVLGVASLALATMGDFGRAQEFLQDAVARDPLNLGSRLRLGLLQEFRGDDEAALATYRQLLLLNPDYPGGHAYRTRVKVLQGKPDSALEEAEQEADPFWGRYARILALTAQDNAGEAELLLEEMVADSGSVAAFQLAEIQAFGGNPGQAFEWLDRAWAQRDPGMASLLGDRLLELLHEDDRWAEMLVRLGLPEESDSGG